jgi:hypothetical protein
LDGGAMCQDGNISIKLPAGHGLDPFIDKDHALPHLQVKTSSAEFSILLLDTTSNHENFVF